MNQYISLFLDVLYYILLPIWLVATWLAGAFKPLYNVLAFLALPLLYLSRFMMFLVTQPFRFLAKFEVSFRSAVVQCVCQCQSTP